MAALVDHATFDSVDLYTLLAMNLLEGLLPHRHPVQMLKLPRVDSNKEDLWKQHFLNWLDIDSNVGVSLPRHLFSTPNSFSEAVMSFGGFPYDRNHATPFSALWLWEVANCVNDYCLGTVFTKPRSTLPKCGN